MPLPDQKAVTTLDYATDGQPACLTAAAPAVNLPTMDYATDGQPFVANPAVGTYVPGFFAVSF